MTQSTSATAPSLVCLEDIAVGTRITTARRTITDADIVAFAGISGDFNALHMDDLFVEQMTPFPGRVAHGLLGVAIGSGLQSDLDRWYTLAYLEARRTFPKPIFAGDTIWAEYEVTDKRESRSRSDRGVVWLDVRLMNQDHAVTQEGVDVLLVGRRPSGPAPAS
jgi:3-hydroxybutyryl-CoA dehydratase